MPEFSQSSFEWPWNSELPCVLLESYEYHSHLLSRYFYRPPMKLREGERLHSCLSVCSMVLMSGGQSTYDWQVGGMYPTGMLSCFIE